MRFGENLTDKQRAEYLERARYSKKVRRKLYEKMARGYVGWRDIVRIARDSDIVGKTRVRRALEALPGIGKTTVARIMARAGVCKGKRIQGLTDRQTQALYDELALVGELGVQKYGQL